MCTYTYIHTNIIQSREEEDTVSGLRPIMVIVSLPLGPAAPASEIDRRVPQGRHNLILHHQYAFNTCLHIGIYDVYTLGMHTCLHMGAAPLSACTRTRAAAARGCGCAGCSGSDSRWQRWTSMRPRAGPSGGCSVSGRGGANDSDPDEDLFEF